MAVTTFGRPVELHVIHPSAGICLPQPQRAFVIQFDAPHPLERGLVHVVAFDAHACLGQLSADVARAHGIAWPAHVARSVPARQTEYVMGRLAARRALQELGLAEHSVGMGPNREPLWPDGVRGSITHIEGLAAAAACRPLSCRGIGIDIERTARGEAQSALRALAINAAEWETLIKVATDDSPDADARVTLAYSAKESLYKAAFPVVRRFFGFDAARVRSFDALESVIVLEMVESVGVPFTLCSRWSVHFQAIEADIWLTSLTW